MSITNIDFGMHVLGNSWNPNATAHQGVSYSDLIDLAAQGGSSIIRIPLDLSAVLTNPSSWAYVVNDIGGDLQKAASLGLKVIFEPGQTPLDLVPSGGTVQDVPNTMANLNELANRYAMLVEAVYDTYPQYADTIAGWEVGNEPNLSYQYTGSYYNGSDPTAPSDSPRYWTVSTDNAEWYATYLDKVADKVHAIDPDIKVIGAGIAHNDPAYMDAMFDKLQTLNANVDGFSVHPYTTYADDAFTGGSPASGRPTDWIESPTSEPWNHYFSFQGALYSMQSMMNSYGYSGADLWVTEFGVPSYQGMRGAGTLGENDQAYWYAEALGVFDSWGNSSLKGIVAHDVLDNTYSQQNNWYNAYDGVTYNDGDSSVAEDSFGLYKRDANTGVISSKLAVDVIDAVANGDDFQDPNIRILSYGTTSTVDLSAWGSSTNGILSGYVVFTHGGNDTVTGSVFDDSIFGGDGNDSVDGDVGNDRLFGGSGDDYLNGNDGDDDIYGNQGDDTISAGANTNRVDGGSGWDVLALEGYQSDFTWSGDASSLTVHAYGGWQDTYAVNIEQITFLADGSTIFLSNPDVDAGNGGASESSSSAFMAVSSGGEASGDGTSGGLQTAHGDGTFPSSAYHGAPTGSRDSGGAASGYRFGGSSPSGHPDSVRGGGAYAGGHAGGGKIPDFAESKPLPEHRFAGGEGFSAQFDDLRNSLQKGFGEHQHDRRDFGDPMKVAGDSAGDFLFSRRLSMMRQDLSVFGVSRGELTDRMYPDQTSSLSQHFAAAS
ncbi:hypothetical protein [Rhodopseudomonas parapalustris]